MDKTFTSRLYRLTLVIFCFCLTIIIGYLFFYYMYPFIIAFIIGILLHPIVTTFESRFNLNRGFTTIFVLIGFSCISLVGGYFLIKQIVDELTELIIKLPSYIESIISNLYKIESTYILPLQDYINKITSINFSQNNSLSQYLGQKLTSNAADFLQGTIVLLSQFFTSFAYSSLVLLFIIIATYFIAKDYEKILILLQKNIPYKVINLLLRINQYAKQSIYGIIKAQISIALLTAIIAFFGLLLFKVEHILIIVGVLFFIDLIPYVGIGAIFIPWIMYAFFSNQYTLSLELSILYIVLIIIRQIIEPRLLAKNLGIHPLIAIIVLFLSINIFGAFGLITTPISLILLSSLYHAKIIHYIVQFIKDGQV